MEQACLLCCGKCFHWFGVAKALSRSLLNSFSHSSEIIVSSLVLMESHCLKLLGRWNQFMSSTVVQTDSGLIISISRELVAAVRSLTVLQRRGASNNIGKRSENTASQIFRVTNKQSVCACVGPDTDWTRLKESMTFVKSFTFGL